MSDTGTDYVDATRPFLRTADGSAVLFPAITPGVWLHAAPSAPTSRTAAGRHRLTVLRTRRPGTTPADPSSTTGGLLTTQIELIAVVASAEQRADWSDQLAQAGAEPAADGRLVFRPLPLRRGRMTARAAAGLLADPAEPPPVDIGAPASVALNSTLTPAGADRLHLALTTGSALPVGVGFEFAYDLWSAPCGYRVTADRTLVHEVLTRHLPALAGCYGPAGLPLDALVAELRETGAVTVRWSARPAGFSPEALAVMETAIVQRSVVVVADRLGARVVPDAGDVRIVLPALSEAAAGELTFAHSGSFGTATFRRDADLPRLRGLTADDHLADVVIGAASLPLRLAFGRDERVDRYDCHVSYQDSAGQVQAAAHSAGGADGLVVDDLVRWTAGGPRPEQVVVQYSIAWSEPEWEPVAAGLTLPTDGPAVTLAVNPGSGIAEVTVATDLASTEVGTLAAVSWTTDLPVVDGEPVRNYSGGFIVTGHGAAGLPDRRSVSFPYRPERAAQSRFGWTVDLATPSGELRAGSGSITLDGAGEVVIVAADLAAVVGG